MHNVSFDIYQCIQSDLSHTYFLFLSWTYSVLLPSYHFVAQDLIYTTLHAELMETTLLIPVPDSKHTWFEPIPRNQLKNRLVSSRIIQVRFTGGSLSVPVIIQVKLSQTIRQQNIDGCKCCLLKRYLYLICGMLLHF